MQRSLTLATQKLDGTLNTAQQTAITTELTALKAEVNNIAARTKFQGGSSQASVFGATQLTSGLPVDASGNSIRAGSIAVNTGSSATTTVTATIVDPDNITGTVSQIQTLIASNATNRGSLGAAINSLEYAIDNMQTLSNNLADGISRIVDTDYAAETSNLTRTQILQQAATSMLAQANQMPNVILTLLK